VAGLPVVLQTERSSWGDQMALRKSWLRVFLKLLLLMLVIVLCALSLRGALSKLSWHMRYGKTLNAHTAEVDAFLNSGRIDALSHIASLDKWHVCSRVSSMESISEYAVILKYCRPRPQEDDERIVAWAALTNGNLMVLRYLLVDKKNCLQRKPNAVIKIRIPSTVEDFSCTLESLGFVKCCHASLLDLENRQQEIDSYDVPSKYLYEARLNEIWLYWETDGEGNILARGAHDSP